MCKYNMRNDIGCKFLYDKILIKIYDINNRENMKNTQQLADRREASFLRYVPGKRGCRGRKTGFVTLSAFSPCGVCSAFQSQ